MTNGIRMGEGVGDAIVRKQERKGRGGKEEQRGARAGVQKRWPDSRWPDSLEGSRGSLLKPTRQKLPENSCV